MSNAYCLRIALFIAFAIAPFSAAFGQTEDDCIDCYGVEIPVQATTRPLVTGIDFDRLLREWIPDFDAFKSRKKCDRPGGITFSYSVPYPEGINKFNPDDVAKLENPDLYTRSIRIQFGVFPSHKEALLNAIERYGKNASPPPVSHSAGFVSIGLHEGSGLIVRDNVYFWLNVKGEGVNELVNVEKIDRAVIDGTDGVYREESISPPILQSTQFLENPIVCIENKGAVQARYSDPSGLPVYVFCRGYASEEKDIPFIRAAWNEENETVVVTGPEGSEGVFRIAAANQYGAVSEENTVRFKIVAAGHADDFTRNAVQSSVDSFQY